jgi:hypothetical protein
MPEEVIEEYWNTVQSSNPSEYRKRKRFEKTSAFSRIRNASMAVENPIPPEDNAEPEFIIDLSQAHQDFVANTRSKLNE